MKGELPILTVPIETEADVVAARQRARRIAELLGFDLQDQTRFATAVSEIARNAFEHGGGGRAVFYLDDSDSADQMLAVRIVDGGAGIEDARAVLDGTDRAPTAIGVGLTSARRLMDRFELQTSPGGGVKVELGKRLSRRQERIARGRLNEAAAQLSKERSVEPLEVLGQQNRELVAALDAIKQRQEELTRLNRELEETNRGVVALYAELDTRAEQLRAASEAKTRFLSNMSHEFRTPLNSILALSRLLLDRIDGELTEEQARQVGYVRSSAESLKALVDDLLDLAKVEAGRLDVRPSEFTVDDLFGGLRGALRPLNTDPAVELMFDRPAPDLPPLFTDEQKVAQILRNLISNALKFTQEGQVRVAATLDGTGERVRLSVSDTGVGIAPEDRARIFEEFAQLDGPLQRTVKGTGLGLPLSRGLAGLLGGEVLIDSELGRGSTFTLWIPRVLTVAQ